MQQADEHDRWLESKGLPKRFQSSQGEAERYKGWIFWTFLRRRNAREMKDVFTSQGWSATTNDRWFGYKLKAWGWPRPPQGEPPQILEAFFKFLLDLVPATEIALNRDDPRLSDYIKVGGWAMLPRVNLDHEPTFRDFEDQAIALLGGNQALLSQETVNPYGPVNSFSPSPGPSLPAIAHRSLKRLPPTSPEPPGFTNVPTPDPNAPNHPSYSQQSGKRKTQPNEVSTAINRSNRPFVASQDTDHQSTLGHTHSAHNPRESALKNIAHVGSQALSNFPSHPLRQLHPSPDYRRHQNISPLIARSKLPQRSQSEGAQGGSTHQAAPTPKRQKADASSPASFDGSIATSSSAWSPYSQSSPSTSMTSGTPLQAWSVSSSPTPYSHGTRPGKERSALDIEGDTEVPDRPSLMSPGAVVQLEQLESVSEASTSDRRSITSRHTLPRRALAYADPPMESPDDEAGGHTRGVASIAHEAIQVQDVQTNDALVEAEKASSDSGSDISSTATTDEDGDSLLDCDGSRANADDHEYILGKLMVDDLIRLS